MLIIKPAKPRGLGGVKSPPNPEISTGPAYKALAFFSLDAKKIRWLPIPTDLDLTTGLTDFGTVGTGVNQRVNCPST